MNNKHTPGPWEIVGDEKGGIKIIAPENLSIANLLWKGQKVIQNANAARIVLCVNVHDELLEALEDLLTVCIRRGKLLNTRSQDPVLDHARAVITKATQSLTLNKHQNRQQRKPWMSTYTGPMPTTSEDIKASYRRSKTARDCWRY